MLDWLPDRWWIPCAISWAVSALVSAPVYIEGQDSKNKGLHRIGLALVLFGWCAPVWLFALGVRAHWKRADIPSLLPRFRTGRIDRDQGNLSLPPDSSQR